jgi:hypothetical protein
LIGEGFGDVIAGNLAIMNTTQKITSQGVNVFDYAEEIKAENRDKQDFNKINNPLDFIAWGFEGVTENAVNLAVSAVVPGGGGLALMALAESGSKMHEMNKEIDGVKWTPEELEYNEKEKERLGKAYEVFYPNQNPEFKVLPKDISALQYFGTAGLYGAAEYFSEKITLGNFKFAKNNIQKAWKIGGKTTKNSGRIIDSDLIPKTKGQQFKTWGIETGKGTLNESVGEGLVSMTQNFSDRYILGNTDVSILDGVTEAMAQGAFMNTTMASPRVLSHAAAAFRPESQNALVGVNGAERLSLSKKRDLLTSQMAGLAGANPALHQKLKIEMNVGYG